jgi:hypothetical protein
MHRVNGEDKGSEGCDMDILRAQPPDKPENKTHIEQVKDQVCEIVGKGIKA